MIVDCILIHSYFMWKVATLINRVVVGSKPHE
jgi:hypothetical protein